MSMSGRIGDPLTGCEDIVTSFGPKGSPMRWGPRGSGIGDYSRVLCKYGDAVCNNAPCMSMRGM